MMLINNIYYRIKPFIPRDIQIILRQQFIRLKRLRYKDSWPIYKKASQLPDNWSGWPEGKQFSLVLTHDVESARGQERCYKLMELEKRYGFCSSFNFVPERYKVNFTLHDNLKKNGFEIGVHGLNHDGRLYESYKTFCFRAGRINHYLKKWDAVGFRSPSMHHNLEWIKALNIQYDASTFDTDPFEAQPDGAGTIFPFRVSGKNGQNGYIELPYTLPQDFTLFILMGCRNIDIWKNKLDWIAAKGGMALVITHPDYMNFKNIHKTEEYPVKYYEDFLKYIRSQYTNKYWHVLPHQLADFWRSVDKNTN